MQARFESRQNKVDVVKPVELTEVTETGALGAAMYAGIGLGIYKDCIDAAQKCIRIKETYNPDETAVKAYEEGFARYMNAFNALNGTFYK